MFEKKLTPKQHAAQMKTLREFSEEFLNEQKNMRLSFSG